ncbi:MAG: hypothetical protein IKM04_06530 [Clostridia bacterium]|nr:hypothetical protein [Clostridia bacterium]
MIRRTIITGSLVIVLIAAVIAGITVYGEGDVPQAEQNIYNNMGQINALVESKKEQTLASELDKAQSVLDLEIPDMSEEKTPEEKETRLFMNYLQQRLSSFMQEHGMADANDTDGLTAEELGEYLNRCRAVITTQEEWDRYLSRADVRESEMAKAVEEYNGYIEICSSYETRYTNTELAALGSTHEYNVNKMNAELIRERYYIGLDAEQTIAARMRKYMDQRRMEYDEHVQYILNGKITEEVRKEMEYYEVMREVFEDIESKLDAGGKPSELAFEMFVKEYETGIEMLGNSSDGVPSVVYYGG